MNSEKLTLAAQAAGFAMVHNDIGHQDAEWVEASPQSSLPQSSQPQSSQPQNGEAEPHVKSHDQPPRSAFSVLKPALEFDWYAYFSRRTAT